MKITFCAYDGPGWICGPNVWLKRLAPALIECGVEIRVLFILAGGSGPTVDDLERIGVECIRGAWQGYTQDRVRWILERVVESPPDLFVANTVAPAYYASRWIRAAGIPTVGVLHSDDEFHWALADEFVTGPPQWRMTAMVCVSEFLANELQRRADDAVRMFRIPCGAPVPSAAAKWSHDRFRLAYVGRLVQEQKRIRDVARALCRATREISRTEAIIFGDGPEKDSVADMLRRSGTTSVTLAGEIPSDQVQAKLLECHCLALLSDYEGMPISVMEAMACGVPPIVLRSRSPLCELVQHQENGLLVDDRDDCFVDAVRQLATNRDFWQTLSTAAKRTIIAKYSMPTIADSWLQVASELVGSEGPAKKVAIPSKLVLPDVHPGLAREDNRPTRLWLRVVKRCLPWPTAALATTGDNTVNG